MSHHHDESPRHLTIRVTHRGDPVSEVVEQDSLRAAERFPSVVIRGPVFGVAEQRPPDGPRWRLLSDMSDGFPQDARDRLNAHLAQRAQDGAAEGGPPPARLLAAVARLESEPVDELRVGATRYRIVRGDEFARLGPEGIEGPRPTDPDDPRALSPEPCPAAASPARSPSRRYPSSPCRTTGFVIDHARATGIVESIQRIELLPLRYEAERIPPAIRADSRRAVRTHPGVVLLPAVFTFAERRRGSWEPMAPPVPTPQDARRTLFSYLSEFLPKLEPTPPADAAAYARAAQEYRSGRRRDALHVLGRRFQIIRVERMMRIGPDGPESPRPSDQDPYGPLPLH